MRKILNKLTCMAVSLTFLMGCMATPAFAYSGGESSEETTAPSIFETDEEPITVTGQDAGPLTPEGNLTVVDDYQTTFSDGTAQQFITLVMQQRKREAEENKADPDADYREDEEEIVLPEEEPENEPDEDAERRAYQGSDGYEE